MALKAMADPEQKKIAQAFKRDKARRTAKVEDARWELRVPTKRVPIGTLNFDPDNARLHPEDNLDALRKSLEAFGQPEPLVVQKATGIVIAGNGRLMAMQSLGWDEVEIREVDWNDTKARAYSVAANRTGELSTWDTEKLEAQLDDLRVDYDLDGLGFDQASMDDLFDAHRGDGEVVEDEVPEPPETPITQVGDLWILGQHLLLCGDSRKAEDVERLFAGAKADAVITDPPYGVSYVSNYKDAAKTKAHARPIHNDGDEGLKALLEASLGEARRQCRDGATWFIAAPAGPQFLAFALVLTDLEIWRQTITWVKDVMVLGHSDYHYRHEVIFYGWVPGGERVSPPDRKQDTVWEVSRPKRSADHPTMKPVELMAKCLINGTRPKALVYEPFAGSGTTLIACEQLERRCRAIEMSPGYCDVIVQRYEAISGNKAKRSTDG